jgi:hypothetical protein
MLDRSTVFVIGAGVGAGLAMPLGNNLSDLIANDLSISFDESKLVSGSRRVVDALRDLARREKLDFNQMSAAGRMVAGGIRYTKSIDNYLNAHRDKKLIVRVGKIAIVHAIFEAERRSALWVNSSRHPFVFQDEAAMRQSWMYDFFSLLQEQIIESENLNEIFRHLDVINFNYDRCIEHFLFRAIQELYPTKGEAFVTELINSKLNIIHPYGKVGNLPWQSRQNTVEFGEEPLANLLGPLSQGILTYNEQVEDKEIDTKIRRQIADAERLIFLGFHFHKQNMQLLTAQQRAVDTVGPVGLFATRVGRADEEMHVIETRVVEMLNGRHVAGGSSYTNECDCKQFFARFGTMLAG